MQTITSSLTMTNPTRFITGQRRLRMLRVQHIKYVLQSWLLIWELSILQLHFTVVVHLIKLHLVQDAGYEAVMEQRQLQQPSGTHVTYSSIM